MVRFPARTNKLPLRKVHRLAVEQLEQRRLLSINASVSNGTLILTTPNNDDFVVTADSVTQLVKVNGLNPQNGSVTLGSFNSIEVVYGAGTMLVDLRGVDSSSFPGLQGTAIHLQAAAPSAAVILPPDSDGQPTDSQLPSQDVDEAVLAQTAFEELVLTWLQEPDEDTDPIQSDAEEQLDPFESIAVGLIGDDWAAQLGIADSADSLNANSWSQILASEDFYAAIDPIRAVDFASQTLGSNWNATHDATDLVATLENGDWSRLILDHPSVMPMDDPADSEVDFGFLGSDEFFPTIVDIDSPVDEVPANTVGPRYLDEGEVADIAQQVSGMGSLLIGADWSEQLNIDEITNVVRMGGWDQFFSNPTLSSALDVDRVSALGEQLLGPKWAKQLGISNVATWLDDGSWRDLLKTNELTRRLGSAKAQVVEDRFRQLVADTIEEQVSPIEPNPIGSIDGGQLQTELVPDSSPMGLMAAASQIPTRKIYGSQFADHIDGSNDPDEIFGEAGNDIIDGHDGNDIIHGGDDDDIIDGSEGAAADVGDDELYGDAGADQIEGGEGNDLIYGGADDDTIDGGEEGDTIYGGDNNLTILSGDDTISGGALNDTIHGEDGNDTILPGSGDDTVDGDAGDDIIYVGFASSGHDSLSGGIGTDRFVFNSSNDNLTATIDTVDLSGLRLSYSDPGTLTTTWTTDYSEFETIEIDTFGGDDTIRISLEYGQLPAVSVNGNLGTDTVTVTGGSTAGDTLAFTLGSVAATGISLVNIESLSISSQGGADAIVLTLPSTGNLAAAVLIDGGSDTDSVTLSGSAANDNLSLSFGESLVQGIVAFLNTEVVTVNTDGGTDRVSIVTNSTSADNVTVDPAQITGIGTTLNYANVEAICLDTAAGNDTVTIRGTSAADAITLALGFFAASGISLINVESPTVNTFGGSDTIKITLPQAGGAITSVVRIDSGGDYDPVLIYGSPLADDITISSGGSIVAGINTIGATQVQLDAGEGTDSLKVIANNSGYNSIEVDSKIIREFGPLVGTVSYRSVDNLTIDTAGGNDAINLRLPAFGEDALPKMLTLVGGSDSGNGGGDWVSIVGTPNDDLLTIAGSLLTANGSPVTLVGVETVELDGSSGNDVLSSTNTTFQYFLLNGDAGRDQISVTHPESVEVHIDGGADADGIVLRDFSAANFIFISADPSFQDRLDVSGNHLTSAQSSHLTVGAIGAVDASHNDLTTLPVFLAQAAYIDVSYNSLVSLIPPQAFNAQTIDARYNQLTTVGALSYLSKLATLLVYGNDSTLSLLPYSTQAINIDLSPDGLEEAEAITPADWLPLAVGLNAYGNAVAAAIPEIAKALHYSPIKIFEYVRNTFAFQPYGGIMKGPAGTLASRAGNDWDQAGLLIALLEAAGVPAERTRFNFGTIQIDAAVAERWVGVTTKDSLTQVLGTAGVSYGLVSNTTFISMQHAWAEVQMYLPGQAGLQWVRLDPSWKFHEQRAFVEFGGAGTSILDAVPFDVNDYLSKDRDELAYEYYENAVTDALLANPATRGLSAADFAVDGPIIAQQFTTLSGLPSDYLLQGAITNYQAYSDVADSTFHRLAIFVKTTGGQIMLNKGAPPFEPHPIHTMDVIFDPIFLDFESGVGTVKPRLWFGQSLAASSTHAGVAPSGASVEYHIQRWAVGQPNSGFDERVYKRSAGLNQVFAVGLDARQLTPGYTQLLQYVAERNAIGLSSNGSPLSPADTAESLTAIIHDHFFKSRAALEIIDQLTNGMPVYDVIGLGAASSETSFVLYPDHQMPIVHDDLRIDIKAGFLQSVSRNQPTANTSAADKREELVYYNASAQEHATIEELTNIKSVSTVRVLQYAKEHGQMIHFFVPGTHSAQDIRDVLQDPTIPVAERFTASQVDAVVADFNAGRTIRVHTRRVTIADPNPNIPGGWTGAAWVSTSSTDAEFAIDDGILTAGGAPSNYARYNPTIRSGPNNVIAGDPVNVANGAVYEDVIDVQIPGVGIPITFERHYDSSNTETDYLRQAGFGVGWTHSYSDYLDISDLVVDYANKIVLGGTVVWVDSKGQRHSFVVGAGLSGTQQWTNSEGLRGKFYESHVPVYGAEHVWSFTDTSGITREFRQLNWEPQSAVRLTAIYDQRGTPSSSLRFTFAPSAPWQLLQIRNIDHPESSLALDWVSTGTATRISQVRQVNSSGATLRTWNYSYTNDRLTKVEAPGVPMELGGAANNRPAIQYTYETNVPTTSKTYGLLLTIEQPDGGIIKHTYHPNGRGFQVIDQRGFAQALEFDLFRTQARFYDEKGRLTVYDYNDHGSLERMIRPDRSRESYTWNSNGYRQSKTDAYGLTEKYTYGSGVDGELGNVDAVNVGYALPNGTWLDEFVQDYDANGVLVSIKNETKYTYDTRVSWPDNGISLSKVSSITPPSAIPNGRKTSFTYDGRGDVLTREENVTPGLAPRRTTYIYDNYGQLVREVDPRGDQANAATTSRYVTKYENYDEYGHPQRISRWIDDGLAAPYWAVDIYDYDANGFLVSHIDAGQSKTIFTVDALGRRWETRLPQPDKSRSEEDQRPSTTSKFDLMGNLKESADPEGRVTKYFYDKQQRLVRTVLPDGSVMENVYDATGTLVRTTDGLGHASNSVVDVRDRIVESVRADGTKSFASFNARGHLLSERDANGKETKYAYDELGRLTRKTLPLAEAQISSLNSQSVWQYSYDAVGNRISESLGWMSGSTIVIDRTTTYTYDSLNRLIKRVDPDPDYIQNGGEWSPVWTYQYDAVGNQTSIQLRPANVAATSPATQQTDFVYDGLNRQKTQTKKISAVEQTQSFYEYDALGNLVRTIDGLYADTYYGYDRWSRLVLQIDPDPDTNGQLRSPYHAYTYDLAGNRLTDTLRDLNDAETLPDRKTEYSYDKMNRPLTITHYEKDGSSTILASSSFSYDAAGNVVAEIDPLGRITRFQYDSMNRRTRTTDALGGVSTTGYDAVGNVILSSDTANNQTEYRYDSLNRLVQTFSPDPDGPGPLHRPLATTIYNFAGDAIITYLSTDVQIYDRRVDFTYDRLHRLIKKEEALPAAQENRHTWQYSYNVDGTRRSMVDPEGLSTQYSYDALGRLLSQIDPDPDGVNGLGVSRTWSYAYDHNGNLVDSWLDTVAPTQRISHTSYVYDALNRRTDEQRHHWQNDTVYSTTHTDYDVVGNIIKSIDAEGRPVQFTYDGLNRVVEQQNLQVTNSGWLGETIDLPHTRLVHDAVGNLLTSTIVFTNTSQNRTTSYLYDNLNRQLAITDPLGHRTDYFYDSVGNLTAKYTAGGGDTYSHDGLGRLVESRNVAPVQITKTEYDEAGNVIKVTDPNNNVTSYGYDGMNRLRKEVQGLLGDSLAPAIVYTYDLHDHIDTIVDRRGWKRDLDYDARGNLLKESWKDPVAPQNDKYILEYRYTPDDHNERAETKVKVGGAFVIDTQYIYDYSADPLRRLTTTYFNDGWGLVTLVYSYNLADQVIRLDVANDAYVGQDSSYYQTRGYDDAGRLNLVDQSGYGSEHLIARLTWNAADQLKSLGRTFEGGGVTFPPVTDDYRYDQAGRLIEKTGGGLQFTYSFDAANRIASMTTTDGGSQTTSTYQYNSANELIAANHQAPGLASESYDLDSNGNRKWNGQTHDTGYNRPDNDGVPGYSWAYAYTYDKNGNVLTRSNGVEFIVYDWDHRNRLIGVTYHSSSFTGPVTRRINYAYDAFDRRITKSADMDGDGTALNAVNTDYVYDGGQVLLSRKNATGAIGVMTHRYLNASAVDFALADNYSRTVVDHEGSVRRLVDHTGNTLANFNYDSFGRLATGGSNTTPAAADFLFGYAGGVYDGETGLQYHAKRYYNPVTGRFLSEDPSSFRGGDANLYRYANGDPVNNTDPTGLSARSSPMGTSNLFFDGGTSSLSYAASSVGSSSSLFSSYSFNSASYSTPTYSPPATSYSARSPSYSQSGSSSSPTFDFNARFAENYSILSNNWATNNPVSLVAPVDPLSRTSIVNTNFNRPMVMPVVMQGAVQATVGATQFIGGSIFAVATAETGAGALAGAAVAVRGLDNMRAGFDTMLTGQSQKTALNQAVVYVTGNEAHGQAADIFADFASPMAMGSLPARSMALAPVTANLRPNYAPSSFTPKVTTKGIDRVEQHLAQFGAEPQNQAMVARLRAGETSTHDITFYMHELKESAIMGRTRSAYSEVYDWQRAAHLETLQWQKIPYAPGYESQIYHPSVISQFPEQFNPAAWPK